MTIWIIDLIGTFCIVNKGGAGKTVTGINDLIGTFCIVNDFQNVMVEGIVNDLIGTFCIVNVKLKVLFLCKYKDFNRKILYCK